MRMGLGIARLAPTICTCGVNVIESYSAAVYELL